MDRVALIIWCIVGAMMLYLVAWVLITMARTVYRYGWGSVMSVYRVRLPGHVVLRQDALERAWAAIASRPGMFPLNRIPPTESPSVTEVSPGRYRLAFAGSEYRVRAYADGKGVWWLEVRTCPIWGPIIATQTLVLILLVGAFTLIWDPRGHAYQISMWLRAELLQPSGVA